MDNNLIATLVVSVFFAASSMIIVWTCEKVAEIRHNRRQWRAHHAPQFTASNLPYDRENERIPS